LLGGDSASPSMALEREHGDTVAIEPGAQVRPPTQNRVFPFDLPMPPALGELVGERAHLHFVHADQPPGLQGWISMQQLVLSRLTLRCEEHVHNARRSSRSSRRTRARALNRTIRSAPRRLRPSVSVRGRGAAGQRIRRCKRPATPPCSSDTVLRAALLAKGLDGVLVDQACALVRVVHGRVLGKRHLAVLLMGGRATLRGAIAEPPASPRPWPRCCWR
jgi:hypothetical protein